LWRRCKCKMIYYLASQINQVIERQVARPARSKTSSQNQPFQRYSSYDMVDTISMLTKHGIKCYVGNIKLYDTCSYAANASLRKVNQLAGDEDLWTGESVRCICTHHVEQHCTVHDQNGREITTHCHGSDERCNCEDFRTRSIRLSHSNCYKMVTEC
jgi:hypothetical protein